MDVQNAEQSMRESVIVGLMACDVPIPIRRLFGTQASKTTFYRWKGGVAGTDGKTYRLRVIDIEGQGPSVVPSELRRFLLSIGRSSNE